MEKHRMKIKIQFYEGDGLFRLEIEVIKSDVTKWMQCNECVKNQGSVMDSCRCEFSHFTDSRNLENWYKPGTSVSLSVKSQNWFVPSSALWVSFSLSTERDRNRQI